MLHSIIELLIQADQQLFNFINHQLHADWLSGIMLAARHELTWIPLYIIVLFKVIQYNKQAAIPFLLISLFTFAITDYCSASVLKPMIGRLRPCYDEATASTMYHLLECGGKYAFPSSHASNHFGMAMCWFACIRVIGSQNWRWLWLWATLICFAQVYVGKHFPLDVFGGAILGIFAGYTTSRLFIFWHLKTNGYYWVAYKKHMQPKSV
jgi:undecaprenyl-diphosphatase